MESAIWFVIIVSLILAVIYFAAKQIVKALKGLSIGNKIFGTSLISKLETSQFFVNTRDINDDSLDVQELYFNDTKNVSAAVEFKEYNLYWCTEYIIAGLKQYFTEFYQVKRINKEPGGESTFIYKGIKGIDVVYIHLDSKHVPLGWFDADSTRGFKIGEYSLFRSKLGKEYHESDIKDVEDIEIVVNVTQSIRMAYPNKEDSLVKREILMDYIDKSRVKFKQPEYQEDPIYLETLNYSKSRGYFLQPETVKDYSKMFKNIDVAYHLDELNFRGHVYKDKDLNMRDVFDASIIGMEEGQNIGIFGKIGSGKSVLQEALTAKASRSPNIRVIQIPTTVASKMGDPEFQSFMTKYFLIKAETENPPVILFVIDEAHILFETESETSRYLLQMLDGTAKKQFNLCFLLIFNKPKTSMLPDVFRSNRIPLSYQLGALPNYKAKEYVIDIKETMDKIKYRFEDNQFESALKVLTYFEGTKTVQSEKNSIVSAQIYECILPKRMESQLLGKLEKAKDSKLETSVKSLSRTKPKSTLSRKK